MIQLLIGAIAPLLDKFIPNKDEAAKLAFELATLAERQAHELAKAQIENNTAEAAHRSIFVSGWRPFCGWVCSTGIAFNFLVLPLLNFGGRFWDVPPVDPLDLSTMMPVLLGMLGLGTMRSYEKKNGVAREK